MLRDYPEVVLEVTRDNSRVDLVAAGFDAGIEIGEFFLYCPSRRQQPAALSALIKTLRLQNQASARSRLASISWP